MSTPIISNQSTEIREQILLSPPEGKVEIGVEQVRNFIKEINFAGKKIAIIEPADALTDAAQNALLKTLEEPPKDTQIYLITQRPDVLLPTLLSRCIISGYQLPTTNYLPSEKGVIDWIIAGNIKDGFNWAAEIKNRQEAINRVESLMSLKSLRVTRKLLKARKYLMANTNVRLTLENLFV